MEPMNNSSDILQVDRCGQHRNLCKDVFGYLSDVNLPVSLFTLTSDGIMFWVFLH